MIRKLLTGIAMLGALCPGMASFASEVEFSYCDRSLPERTFGTLREETYDVAVRLTSTDFPGASVAGVSMPLNGLEFITDITGWMSRELKIEKIDGVKQNEPDIASAEAECSDGMVSVIFPEAFPLSEEGIYIGFTFSINGRNLPDPMTGCAGVKEGTACLHTSRSYQKWEDISAKVDFIPDIRVRLSGDFPRVSVTPVLPEEINYLCPSETIPFSIGLVSKGTEPIRSLEYTYTVDGEERVCEQTFAEVNPQYGYLFGLKAELAGSVDRLGDFPFTLSVTKVNGIENPDKTRSESLLYSVASFPKKRPLVEEFTGLWCGNCPRGYAAMEHMSHKYEEDFVGVTYHGEDVMAVYKEEVFPVPITGYPTAWLDRGMEIDPYFGSYDYMSDTFRLEDIWLGLRDGFTPADLGLKAWFDGDDTVVVDAEVAFVRPVHSRLSWGFMLLADGLSNPRWAQSNYYAGDPKMDLEEMEMFTSGESMMYGLEYNDVILASTDTGNAGFVIDEAVERDSEYWLKHKFDVSGIVNTDGERLEFDPTRLRAVAVVVDTETGKVLNSIWSKVTDGSSVSSVHSDRVSSVEYFDMQGVRVGAQADGPLVKVVRYGDGGVAVEKIIRGN